MKDLEWVEKFYLSNCYGGWEMEYGIKIQTSKSKGWTVDIDLMCSPLEDMPFDEVSVRRESEDDWMDCKVEHNVFKAACGPLNLHEVISIFKEWLESFEIDIDSKQY